MRQVYVIYRTIKKLIYSVTMMVLFFCIKGILLIYIQ